MMRMYRGPSTRRRGPRATAVAAVLVAVASLVPPALAADGTDRLLRAYPLEQQPAQRAPAPAAQRGAPPSGPSLDGSPGGPPWAAILLGSAAAAVLVLVAARRLGPGRARRRDGDEEPLGTVPAPAGAERAVAASAATAESRAKATSRAGAAPRAQAASRAEAPSPAAAAPLPARAPTDRAGEERPPAPAPEAVPQDICQVHWHRDENGSRFEAVVVGGRNRTTVASSPAFDWRGRVPPDRSPGAQAALRALVDDLGEAGWEPLRGRGREAGAPRWYARRFCRPAEVRARTVARNDTQARRPTGVR
jgi:hypothetical protein